MPSPAKPVLAEILKAYEEEYISVGGLFTGGNPFDQADEGKGGTLAETAQDLSEDAPF